MFGLGLSEIITLVIVALVLINPKELPKIMNRIGKIYARIMKQWNGIRKTYDDLGEEIKSAADFDFPDNKRYKGDKK